MISYEYPPDTAIGGIATYVYQAARMLFSRGHEVEVFASSSHREGRFENNGILLHLIRENNRSDFGVLVGHKFAERHYEKPFNVVEGPEYGADSRKAVELVPNIPLVVKMHTPSEVICRISSSKRDRFIKKIHNSSFKLLKMIRAIKKKENPFDIPSYEYYSKEARHARRADILSSPSLDLCRYAGDLWRIDQKKIRHVPNVFEPEKTLLGIPIADNARYVGFIGRLEYRKGVETLIASIPRVLKKFPDVGFIFIGEPQIVPKTKIYYDEWIQKKLGKWAQNIKIKGNVSYRSIPELVGKIDVVVFPSIWENFPNACLESMAAARAIIASSAGGMAEMLDGGKTGILVSPQNSKELADQLIRILKDNELRKTLGMKARQRVIETYNSDKIGSLMETTYQEAIDRRHNLFNRMKV